MSFVQVPALTGPLRFVEEALGLAPPVLLPRGETRAERAHAAVFQGTTRGEQYCFVLLCPAEAEAEAGAEGAEADGVAAGHTVLLMLGPREGPVRPGEGRRSLSEVLLRAASAGASVAVLATATAEVSGASTTAAAGGGDDVSVVSIAGCPHGITFQLVYRDHTPATLALRGKRAADLNVMLQRHLEAQKETLVNTVELMLTFQQPTSTRPATAVAAGKKQAPRTPPPPVPPEKITPPAPPMRAAPEPPPSDQDMLRRTIQQQQHAPVVPPPPMRQQQGPTWQVRTARAVPPASIPSLSVHVLTANPDSDDTVASAARGARPDEDGDSNPQRQLRLQRATLWAPVYPNARHVASFSSDFFEGHALLLVRTDPLDPFYRHVFEGRRRNMEVRVQGRFKRLPTGPVFLGAEVNQTMALGVMTRSLVHGVIKFASSLLPKLHASLGKANTREPEQTELPHFSFPLWSMGSHVQITPPGEPPPDITKTWKKPKPGTGGGGGGGGGGANGANGASTAAKGLGGTITAEMAMENTAAYLQHLQQQQQASRRGRNHGAGSADSSRGAQGHTPRGSDGYASPKDRSPAAVADTLGNQGIVLYPSDFTVDHTVTMRLHTQFLDLANWRTLGVPVMGEKSLHSIWEDAPLSFVAYQLRPEMRPQTNKHGNRLARETIAPNIGDPQLLRGRHTKARKEYLFIIRTVHDTFEDDDSSVSSMSEASDAVTSADEAEDDEGAGVDMRHTVAGTMARGAHQGGGGGSGGGGGGVTDLFLGEVPPADAAGVGTPIGMQATTLTPQPDHESFSPNIPTPTSTERRGMHERSSGRGGGRDSLDMSDPATGQGERASLGCAPAPNNATPRDQNSARREDLRRRRRLSSITSPSSVDMPNARRDPHGQATDTASGIGSPEKGVSEDERLRRLARNTMRRATSARACIGGQLAQMNAAATLGGGRTISRGSRQASVEVLRASARQQTYSAADFMDALQRFNAAAVAEEEEQSNSPMTASRQYGGSGCNQQSHTIQPFSDADSPLSSNITSPVRGRIISISSANSSGSGRLGDGVKDLPPLDVQLALEAQGSSSSATVSSSSAMLVPAESSPLAQTTSQRDDVKPLPLEASPVSAAAERGAPQGRAQPRQTKVRASGRGGSGRPPGQSVPMSVLRVSQRKSAAMAAFVRSGRRGSGQWQRGPVDTIMATQASAEAWEFFANDGQHRYWCPMCVEVSDFRAGRSRRHAYLVPVVAPPAELATACASMAASLRASTGDGDGRVPSTADDQGAIESLAPSQGFVLRSFMQLTEAAKHFDEAAFQNVMQVLLGDLASRLALPERRRRILALLLQALWERGMRHSSPTVLTSMIQNLIGASGGSSSGRAGAPGGMLSGFGEADSGTASGEDWLQTLHQFTDTATSLDRDFLRASEERAEPLVEDAIREHSFASFPAHALQHAEHSPVQRHTTSPFLHDQSPAAPDGGSARASRRAAKQSRSGTGGELPRRIFSGPICVAHSHTQWSEEYLVLTNYDLLIFRLSPRLLGTVWSLTLVERIPVDVILGATAVGPGTPSDTDSDAHLPSQKKVAEHRLAREQGMGNHPPLVMIGEEHSTIPVPIVTLVHDDQDGATANSNSNNNSTSGGGRQRGSPSRAPHALQCCFLEVSTVGRVLQIMVRNEDERQHWLDAIRTHAAQGPRLRDLYGAHFEPLLSQLSSSHLLGSVSSYQMGERRVLNSRRFVYSLPRALRDQHPCELMRNTLDLVQEFALQHARRVRLSVREWVDVMDHLSLVQVCDLRPLDDRDRLSFYLNLYHAILLWSFAVLQVPTSRASWLSFMGMVSCEVMQDIASALEVLLCLMRPRVCTAAPALVPTSVRPTTRYMFSVPTPDVRVMLATRFGMTSDLGPVVLFSHGDVFEQQLTETAHAAIQATFQTDSDQGAPTASGSEAADGAIYIPRMCYWFAADAAYLGLAESLLEESGGSSSKDSSGIGKRSSSQHSTPHREAVLTCLARLGDYVQNERILAVLDAVVDAQATDRVHVLPFRWKFRHPTKATASRVYLGGGGGSGA